MLFVRARRNDVCIEVGRKMMQFRVVSNRDGQWPIIIFVGGIWPAGEMTRISAWCHQTFGNPDDNWNWKDKTKTGEIWLTREEDLTLFMLKWKT